MPTPLVWPFRPGRLAGSGRAAPPTIWPFPLRRLKYTPPLAAALPISLLAAITAKAVADPTLAAITGGVWRDQEPPGKDASPYAVFTHAGASLISRNVDFEWHDERIRFRVYSLDPDLSETLGIALLAAVPAWGPLDYQTGYSIPLYEVDRKPAKTAARRPGDKAAWYVEMAFSARCRRGRS